VLVALLIACGSSEEPVETAPDTTEAEAEARERARELQEAMEAAQAATEEAGDPSLVSPVADDGPPVELHEWGLYSVRLGDPALQATTRGDVEPLGFEDALGKPVLYAHLRPGLESHHFQVAVEPSSGEIVERYPPWDVTTVARRCERRRRHYFCEPRPADGYCEALSGRSNETDDGACLIVDEHEWDHLFYRAAVARQPELPLEVRGDGDGVRVRARAQIPGHLIFVARGDSDDATTVRVVAPPGEGEEVTLPSPDASAEEGVTALGEDLVALGLTENERDAFLGAWQRELFGTGHLHAVATAMPPSLRSPKRMLLYWMPPAAVNEVVRLDVSDDVEVKRILLVRVGLDYDPPRARPEPVANPLDGL